MEVLIKRRKSVSCQNPLPSAERNWPDLIVDLLILVVKRIDSVQDYFAFRAVCPQWRRAAAYEDFNSIRRQPWLLESNIYGSSFSNPFDSPAALSTTVFPEEIREVVGCKGWLLIVQEDKNMYLLHLVSGIRVRLPYYEPSYRRGIDKMVLSASPFTHPLDYTLLINNDYMQMAYWRPGDENFTELRVSPLISDIIFYKGFFYAVNRYGNMLSVANHPTSKLAVVRYFRVLPSRLSKQHMAYLVECDGDLLLVIRFEGEVELRAPEQHESATYFRVYKIDNLDGVYFTSKEMNSLGNQALFLGGFGASFSVNAREIPGCKPNHIYFTGHVHRRSIYFGCRDKYHSGVYSLEDAALVESSVCENKYNKAGCNCFCPPLWVTPTLV